MPQNKPKDITPPPCPTTDVVKTNDTIFKQWLSRPSDEKHIGFKDFTHGLGYGVSAADAKHLGLKDPTKLRVGAPLDQRGFQNSGKCSVAASVIATVKPPQSPPTVKPPQSPSTAIGSSLPKPNAEFSIKDFIPHAAVYGITVKNPLSYFFPETAKKISVGKTLPLAPQFPLSPSLIKISPFDGSPSITVGMVNLTKVGHAGIAILPTKSDSSKTYGIGLGLKFETPMGSTMLVSSITGTLGSEESRAAKAQALQASIAANKNSGKELSIEAYVGGVYSVSDGAILLGEKIPQTRAAALMLGKAVKFFDAEVWAGAAYQGSFNFKNGELSSITINGKKVPVAEISKAFAELKPKEDVKQIPPSPVTNYAIPNPPIKPPATNEIVNPVTGNTLKYHQLDNGRVGILNKQGEKVLELNAGTSADQIKQLMTIPGGVFSKIDTFSTPKLGSDQQVQIDNRRCFVSPGNGAMSR